jgi:hypothetical protein
MSGGRTKKGLPDLMGGRLDDVGLPVLMIDGVGLKDHAVVAPGLTTHGGEPGRPCGGLLALVLRRDDGHPGDEAPHDITIRPRIDRAVIRSPRARLPGEHRLVQQRLAHRAFSP